MAKSDDPHLWRKDGGFGDYYEIKWSDNRWDFIIGDTTSCSHYTAAEVASWLKSSTIGMRDRNAICFVDMLVRYYDIPATLLQPQEVLAMSPSQLEQATWYDVFVCHASEDKEEFVRPFAAALSAQGVRVWYDEFELRWGTHLRRCIDAGLARSHFGVVVLSPAFFSKQWPQYELDGLFHRHIDGDSVLLPIWHHVARKDVLASHPSLVDIVALSTAQHSLDEIAKELLSRLSERKGRSTQ